MVSDEAVAALLKHGPMLLAGVLLSAIAAYGMGHADHDLLKGCLQMLPLLIRR
jgi:hypothetical protein